MNSRERLLAVFDRKPADRIPRDLGGSPISTISKIAYDNVRAHLGLAPDTAPDFMSFNGQSVRPAEDLLAHFGIDTRSVQGKPGSAWKLELHSENGYEFFHDEWGVGYRRPLDSKLYYDLHDTPLADKEADFTLAYPFPDPTDPRRLDGIREKCQAFRDAGRAVVFAGSIGMGEMHTLTYLMGFEDFFMKILAEPDEMRQLHRRVLDVKLAFWDKALGAVGDLVDVVYESDDLGMQGGPLFAPDLYREAVKPFHRELFAFIKKKAPHARIMFHSCGSIVPFIPDLIEIGVDALNPVQVSAAGMDPAFLKREFGRDLVFWGGAVDTQNVLPTGTPAEVREYAKRNIAILSENGGYVMNTVHNIQADVPPENIVALYQAADDIDGQGKAP